MDCVIYVYSVAFILKLNLRELYPNVQFILRNLSSAFVVGPNAPWLFNSELIVWAQRNYMFHPSREMLTPFANTAINFLAAIILYPQSIVKTDYSRIKPP